MCSQKEAAGQPRRTRRRQGVWRRQAAEERRRQGLLRGPADSVVEMGAFQHAVEGDMLIKSTNEKVPY